MQKTRRSLRLLECPSKLLSNTGIGFVLFNAQNGPAPTPSILEPSFRYTHIQPFKADTDSGIALTLSFGLQFLFLLALLIKVDGTSEDEADERMFGFLLIFVFSEALFFVPPPWWGGCVFN